MTKISIYCYEKNGGGCRNKVSSANNFICGAGHNGARQGGFVLLETPAKTSTIDLSGMWMEKKRALASDISTPPEILAELAKEKDSYINRALVNNSSTPPEILAELVKSGDRELLETFAESILTPKEILAELVKSGDRELRRAVAGNPSASLEMHISLAQQGHIPFGFTKNKLIDELIKDINLVDQYPDTFGYAYLYRLLDLPSLEDKNHLKKRALVGYTYTKLANDPNAEQWKWRYYKDRIKTLFPDDQELAEIVGY